MSATQSEDAVNAVANQGGEFRSRVAPSEPLLTTGHQVGKKVSPADHAPEFHVQVLPAGTAPADRTFEPNPTSEAPPVEANASAADTLQGATSADVHTGLGHPGQGQSSAELHDNSKPGSGLAGLASGVPADTHVVDEHDPNFAGQRGLKGEAQGENAGERENTGGLAAQEREPQTAESVSAEAPAK